MSELDRLRRIMQEVRDSFLEGDELPVTCRQINNGWCADYATAVWERMGGYSGSVNVLSDEDMGAEDYTHTFLECEDLYFDAQCIEGVDDWTQLPIFQEEGDEVCIKCGIVAEYVTKEGPLCEGHWHEQLG